MIIRRYTKTTAHYIASNCQRCFMYSKRVTFFALSDNPPLLSSPFAFGPPFCP